MTSPVSFPQMIQLYNKLQAMGWDPARIASLGQATPTQFRAIEAVLDRIPLELLPVAPADFFKTRPGLCVSADLEKHVDLGECDHDHRTLSLLFRLPRPMDDSDIADYLGGESELIRRATTLPQIMRELGTAISGKSSLINKKQNYIFYLIGLDGLYPVVVRWTMFSGVFSIDCYPFGRTLWDEGYWVYGNSTL